MRRTESISCLLLIFMMVSTLAVAQEADAGVAYGAVTPGRLRASLAALGGLISAILGGLSWLRSSGRWGTGSGRPGALVAGAMGAGVIGYAVLHLTMFTGGLGTGSGRAGAVVAIAMGLAGVTFAAITLMRSGRAVQDA